MVSEIAENLGVVADEGDVLIGIDALKARVEKLEQALRFYSNSDNYEIPKDQCWCSVEVDAGYKASRALEDSHD